jgi:hypothetical protein
MSVLHEYKDDRQILNCNERSFNMPAFSSSCATFQTCRVEVKSSYIHLSIYIYIYIRQSIYPSMYLSTGLVDLGRFFQFFNLYTVGRTPWTGDQHVARPLPTHRTT